MSEHNQQFADFEQWLNHANMWLTRHPQYNDTEHGHQSGWRGHHFKAICFDAKGRICKQGADFGRARDENTFPVYWVWPDQVPALALAALQGRIPDTPHKG
jgi:hypothetical protein